MAPRFPVVFLKSAANALPIALPIVLPIVFTISAAGSLAAEAGERAAASAQPTYVGLSSRPAASATVRSSCGIPGFDQRLLELINRMRSRGADCGQHGVFTPAAPLGWSARLSWSADVHAVDMARYNYFGHVGRADGPTVEHRLQAVGQPWGEYAENLAAGLSSVDEVLGRWSASPAHCANLMNPNFTEVGAACVPAASPNRFKTYWALDLVGP